ncbi:MAG: thermonuclease family protein [Rhodospirillales bacterium]
MTSLYFLLVALLLAPAAADERQSLRPGPEAPIAEVAEVIDGDTVVVSAPVMGATQIRLVGLQAPKLALGREGFRPWPLADDARRALANLVLGRRLALSFGGAERDRHGRLLAHLHTADGLWVQGEMLARGMARVYSFPDNRARVAEMLALEAAARGAKRGIWGHPFYAVRAPEDLARLTGTFQLVEGRVLRAARVKGRVYLNYGEDWRTDFTVTMDAKAGRLFRKAGADPLAFGGRRLRVRGWIKQFNGPMIEATHPEQVEVLAD